MAVVKLATTPIDITQCLRIRETVFVAEQNVPLELEHDEFDRVALHFLVSDDGVPIATARVVFKDDGATAKIGRVAVLASQRGAGIGKLLMTAIEAAPELAGADKFGLEAQIQALGFYERLGYRAYGEEFLDAGIPHRFMEKRVGINDPRRISGVPPPK